MKERGSDARMILTIRRPLSLSRLIGQFSKLCQLGTILLAKSRAMLCLGLVMLQLGLGHVFEVHVVGPHSELIGEQVAALEGCQPT